MAKVALNLKAGKEVKEKAQKVAYELGNAYLKQFIRTEEVYFYLEGELKPSVKKRLDRLQKEALAGKNLSPVFSNARKATYYLKSL